MTINHQRSKSEDFEHACAQYMQEYLLTDLVYLSVLRPYYEINIAKKFSQLKQYFPVFSSCNRNFHLQGDQDKRRCGHCPKCLFTYSILRPYLSKEQTHKIRGEEYYENPDLTEEFEELRGIRGIKPLECVGTAEEMTVSAWLYFQELKKQQEELPVVLQHCHDKILQHKTDHERKKLAQQLLQTQGEEAVLAQLGVLIPE